jgi:hypothetical protein
VRFDNNKYSVTASAVGRPVEVHAYADRIVIRQDGRIVAEHPRSFGRGETTYDPWHYVPVLARKPGALRNGAPFKDWVLPPRRFTPTSFERRRSILLTLAGYAVVAFQNAQTAAPEANITPLAACFRRPSETNTPCHSSDGLKLSSAFCFNA